MEKGGDSLDVKVAVHGEAIVVTLFGTGFSVTY